jgi:hypothetical protein
MVFIKKEKSKWMDLRSVLGGYATPWGLPDQGIRHPFDKEGRLGVLYCHEFKMRRHLFLF